MLVRRACRLQDAWLFEWVASANSLPGARQFGDATAPVGIRGTWSRLAVSNTAIGQDVPVTRWHPAVIARVARVWRRRPVLTVAVVGTMSLALGLSVAMSAILQTVARRAAATGPQKDVDTIPVRSVSGSDPIKWTRSLPGAERRDPA